VERSSGFLGGGILVIAKNVFWTMTVWKDEAAMNAYRTSGAHSDAMPRLLNWCDQAAVVHWTQESSEVPLWPEAQQRMAKDGRKSKVNHPSSAHKANQIPEPGPIRSQSTLKPRP
jgi:hypothetical protein